MEKQLKSSESITNRWSSLNVRFSIAGVIRYTNGQTLLKDGTENTKAAMFLPEFTFMSSQPKVRMEENIRRVEI